MLNLKDPSLLKTQKLYRRSVGDRLSGHYRCDEPGNGEVVATTANGNAADAERAVEAAAEAFKTWSRTPAKQRAVLLRNWFNLLMANADDLGAIMTAEQGKPLFESIGEVGYGASFIEYYAEESKRVMGATIPTIANDRRLQTYKQPDWCRRLYYAVEFPERNDCPQGRPCPGRRMHDRYQTGNRDSVVGT